MLIGPGAMVTMRYVVRDEAGRVLEDMHRETPVKFVFGDKRFPVGLTAGLAGMGEGEEKSIRVSPGRGYGERREELVIRVRAGDLPEPPRAVGDLYSRLTETGRRELFTVKGFVGDRVILDRNHPFAGKTITYDVSVTGLESVPRSGAKTGEG